MRIEINFLDSFATSILIYVTINTYFFGGVGGEEVLYKEMTGHGLDDSTSNPARGVFLHIHG